MATVETLSPSSDTRCLLPSTSENMATQVIESLPFTIHSENKTDSKSAPEGFEYEENEHVPNQGKQPRGRRRKRRNSISDNPTTIGVGSGNQTGKRRRGNFNHRRQMNLGGRIILPNKFLLGGNISDPLNLNSMMDEKINRALNAVTPSSSPLPPRNSTIEIVLPSDVTDPLGLNSSSFEKPAMMIEGSKNKNKRKRRRKSHAVKIDSLPNSDTTSNSDDQKAVPPVNIVKGSEPDIKAEIVPTLNQPSDVLGSTGKTELSQQIIRKNSPKTVGKLTVPISQTGIKDPIVSPVVPQDVRRYRSTFIQKSRRKKHTGGKPVTCNAVSQTDYVEIISDDQFRCRSEKTTKHTFIAPVRRRRTVSENLSQRSWDDAGKEQPTIRTFFGDSPVYSASHLNRSVSALFQARREEELGEKWKETKVPGSDGKSPVRNFMNKERKTNESIKSNIETGKETFVKLKRSPRSHEQHDRDKKHCKKVWGKGANKQKAHFQYGNYSKYYGYRNPEKFKDVRMDSLKKEWFKEKDVLDIGCNAGHLTLLIARNYEPRKIVGVDIDDGLIRTARNNIRHYASIGKSSSSKFPVSMAISFGPLAVPPIETGKDETTAAFPNNVNFFQGNYVPQKDEFLRFQEPEYDIIMCMSVTKWIHLNWGDDGLIRMFKRVYKQLRAGGMFILEPQQWDSYKSKRRMTETLNENFRAIKLHPQSFPNFLIREIGFERVEHLMQQKKNKAAGFQRPIQVYYKPE